MAQKTKTRTHRKATEEELAKIPRLMVLRLGSSLRNRSLGLLVRDMRLVLLPHTAIRLRERKLNKLRDFVVMAGPLGVTQMLVFAQLQATGAVSLRIGKMPHGPTLHLAVNSYSLCKDVRLMLRRPKSAAPSAAEFAAPPLLVLHGFSTDTPHEKVLVSMLQNWFPAIDPQATRVSGIKRVLMLSKDDSGSIELRHYAISTRLVDASRNVKRLLLARNSARPMVNLARATDVADLLLDPYAAGAATSESEVDDDAVVDVGDLPAAHKRAIKLTELGPRLNLSLVKIEEGFGTASRTIYHASVEKLELQLRELERRHEKRRRVKSERRAAQQLNVDAKKKLH